MSKNIGDLKGRITMDATSFKDKMNEARSELDKTSNSSKNLSRDFGAIQKASILTGGAVLLAIGGSVKVAANFEQAMARVKAISGATDEQFASLEKTARDLGASTQYSASEAAEGMSFLAMAGFDVNETISAMPGVLNLAAAAQVGLGTSADIVSNILSGFGISAEESERAVDVLVKTMSTANTDLPMLGDAMKYVAPVASALGLSLEETAAAVGKMSDAGIQGSQAGTALRAMLLSLANPTGQTIKAMENLGIEITNADGAMKPIPELIGHIGTKLEGMEDAQKTATAAQLVGTEAASGFLALLAVGEDGLADYTEELKNAGGTAERVAETQMDTLTGSFKEFQSALEEAGIVVGNEFLPIFREIVDVGADIIRKFAEFDPESVKLVLVFAGITAGVALTLSTLGKLSLALSAFALTPVGAAIIGVSLLAGVIGTAIIANKDATEVTLDHAKSLIEEQESMAGTIEAYDALKNKMLLSTEELSRFVDINSELKRTSDPAVITALKDEQEKLREKSNLTNAEFETFLGLNDDIINIVPESNTILTEQGNILLGNTANAKEFNAAQLDTIRIELDAQKLRAESNLRENLAEEKKLLGEMKILKEEMLTGEKDQIAQTKYLDGLKRDLAAAEAEGRVTVANLLMTEIILEEDKLQKLKEQRADTAEKLIFKGEELEKIQAQIGLLDEVKYKMVELELKQVGINAKKGDELYQIDTSIMKLNQAKKKLEETTPVNKKNTDEYRESVAAIEKQVGSLETARQRILDIITEAGTMNATLGKTVYKDVIVRTSGNNSLKNLEYHSGGIVGKPKMHSGGAVSKVMENLRNTPMHNEIDVRLLKREVVLTEAQQANFMRQIDAGDTGGSLSMQETNDLLREIADGLAQGKDISIVMNDRMVGELVEEHVTNAQERKRGMRSTYEGVVI